MRTILIQSTKVKGNKMAINLLRRWVENRERMITNNYTPDQMRTNLHTLAREHVSRAMGNDWHSLQRNRFRNMSGYAIQETQRMYQTVGKELAQAIADDEWTSALDAINQYGTRISFCSDLVEVLNKQFRHKSFFCCEDCSDYFERDDGTYTYSGDNMVCNSCLEDNYTYSDRQDAYISNQDYEDEQDEDDEDQDPEYEHIGSYHSSKRNLGHIPSSYDMRSPRVLLGLELEIEVSDDYDKDTRAGLLLDKMSDYKDEDGIRHTYCLMEEDGSLDNGFEMVTAYTGLDVHKAQLQYFKTKTSGLTSHDTSTCGLHVHVCKSSMTTLHAAKMVLFINDPANIGLVKAIARRSDASYSKIKNKKEDKHWLRDSVHSSKDKDEQIRRLNADRYEALNFKNDRTIEFRLFKGTLKYETMIACLEFSFACWHFTASASASELTTGKFLEFICMPEHRKDTRFLRAYLKEKGYALADNLRQTTKPAPVVETI
jgi:hypothetical protein